LSIRNDCFAWLVDTAVHVHDQLVLEANICVQEEITELVFERLEKGFRNLVLDLGWQFVVKIKFFNNQIVIVNKSILNEFLDRVVKPIWNLFFFIAVFKPEQPKVKLLHSSIDQAFKRLVT